MFDLEKQITEWRRQMLASGIKSPVPLDELEAHLREDIESLQKEGKSQSGAFRAATQRLGKPSAIRSEFLKIRETTSMKVGLLFWGGATAALAVALLNGMFAGRLNFLLFSHILTLTSGYVAAFLTGGLAIYYVSRLSWGNLSTNRAAAVRATLLRFSVLASVLVVVGVFSGLVWSRQNTGQYLTGDARAIGPMCVLLWLAASLTFQRFGQPSLRTTVLLSIVGNMVVALAWQFHGMRGAFFLFLTIHGVFLVIAALRQLPITQTSK